MTVSIDDYAIRGILAQYEAAWNHSDSIGCAARFAEDATLIQIFGGQLDGRAAIEASHRHILNTIYRNSRLSLCLRALRFVRPDVAIVFTRAHVSFNHPNAGAPVETRPTLTLLKQDREWRIVAFQNTRISEMPAAAEAARIAS